MKAKGYKTVVVNGVAALLPVLDYVVNNGAVLGPLLGPQGAAAVTVLGLINVGLRSMTDTPVFKGRK